MKPLDLLGRALTEAPKIIDAVGAIIESVGKRTRRWSGMPPAGDWKREADYQRVSRHLNNNALRNQRCIFCGVLLGPDNAEEFCPGPPR